MGNEGPWVRFFPSDWLAGTRGLSATETGIYITLIAMMYERGAPIANEPTRLARLCGTTPASLKTVVSMLLDSGKLEQTKDGLWNRRVGVETKQRREKSRQAAESAETRWQKEKENQRQADANALRTQSERNASQKPEPDIRAASQQPRTFPADRLIEAASINGGCHPNLVTGIADALAYLEKGYDLEGDFLPVVRAKASPSIRTWRYFGAIVEDNAKRKQQIAPKPAAPVEDWAKRLEVWRDGTWAHSWGPKPGENGCRVPAELIEKARAA